MRTTVIVLSLSLLVACGEGENKPPSPAPGGAMPPTEVDVILVQAGSAIITQDLPGRLSAVRSAQVRARIEGVVEKRLFTEGTDIPAGMPLFQIDARTYAAAAAAAAADLDAAKAALERYAPLLEIKAVSQQEYDQTQARYKQSEAALAKARLDLENSRPSSPISGRIGRALVTEGALVGKGEATHLVTVEQLDPIRVEFTQSYSDLLRLQQSVRSGGQRKADSTQVELVLEDGSIYRAKGRLQFTDLAVDPNTGAVTLRAEFPNPQRELLPGSFVRVRFPEARIDHAIRVPQRAVMTGPQGQTVMIVDNEGKAVVRPVITGAMAGEDFVIGSGLASGERVIVNGLQKIRPGSLVKPVPWSPGAPLLVPPGSPADPGGGPAGSGTETRPEAKK